MTPLLFEALLQELIDENPFAIRAALRIVKVHYTCDIPTLAVTCEDSPRLLVNLDFLKAHAHTEAQTKAVVIHEFLHILLRHTEGRQPLSPARHLAFDAVINAIIHRQYGAAYSSMMATYYAEVTGLQKLLRPMNLKEQKWFEERHRFLPQWVHAWKGLYEGVLVADDIESLAESLAQQALLGQGGQSLGLGPFDITEQDKGDATLLGNHDDLGQDTVGDMGQAMEEALKQMNGHGIWRSPGERGIGGGLLSTLFDGADTPVRQWEAKTLALIKRYISPDRHSRTLKDEPWSYRIPVLSPADRRAFLRAQWSAFLPEAAWQGQRRIQSGTAQVYLDVSGSMNAEMPAIISLLNRLGRNIRRPFWAFSDSVHPAVIEKGQLQTSTSGGTSMQCVLEHVAATRPEAAIVVTDGYIEAISRQQVAATARTKLHVLVTRDGSPKLIAQAGLPYTQLERIPS